MILIDQAQLSYVDERLWRGALKNVVGSGYAGLHFVLFSAYGSFSMSNSSEPSGTPIEVPPHLRFGLRATAWKPGLQLSRAELDEMLQHSIGHAVADTIWDICDGHIGIARAMLMFLSQKFGPTTVEAGTLETALRSVELIENIQRSHRGIQTTKKLRRMKQKNHLQQGLDVKIADHMDRAHGSRRDRGGISW